ncbi:hypothetical protein OG413_41485 [Streptomyces sp. NBC_01433]|uniref:hypothetical protein n=1 Tax=Streptomyces sp. NBC_01433 TaxID=2903864 RepID=UPI00224F3779|nr:hypothetical protein [Streptomyces sp. NBC_01433]MCX4681677.1 hypothetical protein [Streptomyces sp. NBC_01433]
MYEKPDLDSPLAALRTNITAWQASLERHLSERRKGKGIAFDVQLMEDRDDIAAKLVEDFTAIDAEMSKRRVIDSAAPSAWSIERLTDAELAVAKADWPELALFNDVTLRLAADVLGIRMVRDMARQAVRNAPAVLDSRTK